MLLELKLHRTSLLIERKLNGYLHKAGIDVTDLAVLIAASEKPQSQIEIATALEIHPNLVTQACGRLQRIEYIERQHDPEDRRRFLVFLSPLGHSLVRETKAARAELARLIFYPLNEEEIEQFDSLLTKLLENPGEPFAVKMDDLRVKRKVRVAGKRDMPQTRMNTG